MKNTIIVLFALCLIAGCVTGTDSTGAKTYRVDPNKASSITAGVNTVNTIGTAVLPIATAIWPQFALIFGAIGAAVGYAANLWSKLNPVLAAARNKTQIINDILSGVVKAVEAVGQTTPAAAEAVKAQVAANLDVAGLTAEGKAIISAAKL